MKLVKTNEWDITMLFVEERTGIIQKLIKLINEILIKSFRWLRSRRK